MILAQYFKRFAYSGSANRDKPQFLFLLGCSSGEFVSQTLKLFNGLTPLWSCYSLYYLLFLAVMGMGSYSSLSAISALDNLDRGVQRGPSSAPPDPYHSGFLMATSLGEDHGGPSLVWHQLPDGVVSRGRNEVWLDHGVVVVWHQGRTESVFCNCNILIYDVSWIFYVRYIIDSLSL